MKRLIVCFDGTWNDLDKGRYTNVAITAQAIAREDVRDGDGATQQIVYYDAGVGTTQFDAHKITKQFEKWGGGLFGHGLLGKLVDAYRFLVFNYNPGDEIFVFGFSRGAFSARSFTGLLRSCGLLALEHIERISEAVNKYQTCDPNDAHSRRALLKFRADYAAHMYLSEEEAKALQSMDPKKYNAVKDNNLRIQFLGVWDTVGSLGVPNTIPFSKHFNAKYDFHDKRLSNFVKEARHAVAIDERRKSFNATLWENLDEAHEQRIAEKIKDGSISERLPLHHYKAPYQEMWFPGEHGAVGGGGERRALSDEPLNWIWHAANGQGLVFADRLGPVRELVRPSFLGALDNSGSNKGNGLISKLMARLPKKDREPGPQHLSSVSHSARYRYYVGDRAVDATGEVQTANAGRGFMQH